MAAMVYRMKSVDGVSVKQELSSPPSISVSIPSQVDCVHDDCDTRMLLQNFSNFKRSGPPARLMYYEDGSWADFAAEVVEPVRLGFEEGKAVVEVGIGGAIYLFDLYRMLQVELESGNQRSIAWIDVHGKSFFPKTFVNGGGEFLNSAKDVKIVNVSEDLAAENPKIEIEIRIGENSNSTKRKKESVEIEPEGSSSNVRPCGAKRSRLITHEEESPRWPKAKRLKEGEKAFSIVKTLFLSGLGLVEPGAMITSIHQWMRSGLLDKARYEVFLKQLETTKAARGDPNMTFAWYGTSAKGVATILGHGFGIPSKIPSAEAHGVGIYLSPIRSPHLSAMLSEADDNGEKYLILCRVILGKCEKVEAGSKQLYPSNVDFDTGVDDLMNPKWYVVWCANMNTRILPECVLSYRSSDFAPGKLRGPSFINSVPGSSFINSVPGSSNMLLSMLQSKIGNSVPSSRVDEFRNLCTAYKDGKVAKDAFVEQLRSVVGDDMLASVIHREVCG